MTAELTQEWNELDAVKEATPGSPSTTASTQDVELNVEPTILITKDDLLALAKDIVVFYMAHNAEADACDLLMEIEQVDLLVDYVEKETYQRVCLYLLGSVLQSSRSMSGQRMTILKFLSSTDVSHTCLSQRTRSCFAHPTSST